MLLQILKIYLVIDPHIRLSYSGKIYKNIEDLELFLPHSKSIKRGNHEYLIFNRSITFNDYMQVLIEPDQKYKVEYSYGYSKNKPTMYVADGVTRAQVVGLLYSYASGTDLHKNFMNWRVVNISN